MTAKHLLNAKPGQKMGFGNGLSLFYALLVCSPLLLLVSPAAWSGCSEVPADTFTCDDSPPNPDTTGVQAEARMTDLIVNVLPDSIVDTSASGSSAINTGSGDDTVTVEDAEVNDLDRHSIDTHDGDDTVLFIGSQARCEDDCINVGDGNDRIEIIGSTIISDDNNPVNARDGNETIIIRDSQVLAVGTGDNFGISGGNGDEQITVSNSTVQGSATGDDKAMVLGDGDETVRLEDGARLVGYIECGTRGDTDPDPGTIIFAMSVPGSELMTLNAQIASADPAGDNITINGEYYEWLDCTALKSELRVGPALPVPVLPLGGLLLLIMGLAGIGSLSLRH